MSPSLQKVMRASLRCHSLELVFTSYGQANLACMAVKLQINRVPAWMTTSVPFSALTSGQETGACEPSRQHVSTSCEYIAMLVRTTTGRTVGHFSRAHLTIWIVRAHWLNPTSGAFLHQLSHPAWCRLTSVRNYEHAWLPRSGSGVACPSGDVTLKLFSLNLHSARMGSTAEIARGSDRTAASQSSNASCGGYTQGHRVQMWADHS